MGLRADSIDIVLVKMKKLAIDEKNKVHVLQICKHCHRIHEDEEKSEYHNSPAGRY